MVSLVVRQSLIPAARALALAAIVAPYAGVSQLARDAANFEQLAETILAEQGQQGPYSPTLLDPLRALSLIYEERGEHALALAVINQALQVVRANSGLRSLDQAPLIRQSIHNEEARGNFAAAWELEQGLLKLARRHPEDLRTVPILREIGDKRLDLLERYLAGEIPPQIVLGCFYQSHRAPHLRDGSAGSCTAGSKGVAARGMLSAAQRNYADAARVLVHNKLYTSPELHDLEMELIGTSYLHGGAYGRQSLRRLFAYDVMNDEPWLTRMQGYIKIVDWDFVFGNKATVLATYSEVLRLLEENGTPQAAIDDIFAPPLPVALPAFLANPLASPQTPDSTGFIDAAFEITKYGRSRRIEILGTTTNATKTAKNQLVRLISRSDFRPRLANGKFADRSPVVVRYYLNDKTTIAQPIDVDPLRPVTYANEFAMSRRGGG